MCCFFYQSSIYFQCFSSPFVCCFGNVRRPQVDCTENQELCLLDPWRVTEYPTIYISRKGKLVLYEGEPEHKDIVAHMRKMNRPRPVVRHKALSRRGLWIEERFGNPIEVERG